MLLQKKSTVELSIILLISMDSVWRSQGKTIGLNLEQMCGSTNIHCRNMRVSQIVVQHVNIPCSQHTNQKDLKALVVQVVLEVREIQNGRLHQVGLV